MFSPNKQDTKSPTGYIMSTSLMDEILEDFFSADEENIEGLVDSQSHSLTTQGGSAEGEKTRRENNCESSLHRVPFSPTKFEQKVYRLEKEYQNKNERRRAFSPVTFPALLKKKSRSKKQKQKQKQRTFKASVIKKRKQAKVVDKENCR